MYLSINQDGYITFDKYTDRLLNYIIAHDNDSPFTLRQIDPTDERFYLREDETGYTGISLTRLQAKVCREELNNKGYKRICYKDKKPLKGRLIYKLYGENPYNLDLEAVEIHHKNLNSMDDRKENLYAISKENHRILHKYIDKYGVDNVEI